MEHLPTKDQVLENIKTYWKPQRDSEIIPVTEAKGRIAAEDVVAVVTLPVFRSAKSDAIALRSADFQNGMPDTSNWVLNEDYARADMGDDFDDKFDATIPVESVILEDGKITFREEITLKPGKGVSHMGSMVAKGDLLVQKGTRLSPLHLANLQMGGITEVPVKRKPRVVFIPTGSELIPAGETPERGQIIDSNSLFVKNFLEDWGAEVMLHPIVKDNATQLEAAFEKAKTEGDIVLINGGSSMGSEDLCTVLLQKDAEYFQHYVRAVPGRPASFAVAKDKLLINIPGPTKAAFAVLHWCVNTAIALFYEREPLAENKVTVRMENAVEWDAPLVLCTWFDVEKKNGEWVAKSYFTEKKLSEVLCSSNAYGFIPMNSKGLEVGDLIEVYWIDPRA